MAAIRPQLDTQHSTHKPFCSISLLVCPSGLAFMLPSNVPEGRICIPTLCLKYLVICIANALLATGWLLISVLSVLTDVLPSMLNAPPTLPKMSAREASSANGGKERPVQASVSMTTGVELSYESESGGKIFTSRTVLETTQTVKRSDSASHRVRFAGGEEPGPTASTSRLPVATPPETPERRTTTLPSEPIASSPESIPHAPLPSPPPSGGSNDSCNIRGRKLSFLRRQFSEKHRSAATRGSALPTPPSSTATSPARSPERREHVALQRSSTTPHGAKCPQRKCGEQGSAKKHAPVLRTDPYQAPYFFPSPLSPDALDYVDKVRSERVLGLSPEHRSKPLPPSGRLPRPSSLPSQPSMLPTPTSSPQRNAHLDLAPEPPPLPVSTAAPEIASSSADPSSSRNNSVKRRSWRVSLHHRDNYPPKQSLERPTSWASEATTIGSSSGESSNHAVSSKPRLSGFWSRRSPSHPLTALSPLESTVGIDDVQSLKHKRSWHIFHHHRSVSDAHPAASPSPLAATAQRLTGS